MFLYYLFTKTVNLQKPRKKMTNIFFCLPTFEFLGNSQCFRIPNVLNSIDVEGVHLDSSDVSGKTYGWLRQIPDVKTKKQHTVWFEFYKLATEPRTEDEEAEVSAEWGDVTV